MVFGRSKRNIALLAGAAGFNLLLGVAVASGVVPQAHSVSLVSEESAVNAIEVPVAADLQPSAAAEAGVAEAAPETTPPTTEPATTTSTTEAAAKTAQHEPSPAPEADPAPAPEAAATPAPAPAQSAAVPRLNPPSFNVVQAIQALAVRIPLFRPNEAQARQFGDMVCTAFDQGKSYAEVRAAVLSAVGQVPGLSVSPSDADYAIRTAVELFCPGHKSKLA